MKRTTKFIAALLLVISGNTYFAQAQTADEIINKYLEQTGGIDAWNKLEGFKMNAKVDAGGMTIPLEIYELKDGRKLTKFEFQGKEIIQDAFDGETAWGVNFMTMKAEKSDDEATENTKRGSKDFPGVFFNYKVKRLYR